MSTLPELTAPSSPAELAVRPISTAQHIAPDESEVDQTPLQLHNQKLGEEENDKDPVYKTPTEEEFKIPPVSNTCPPAPRKPRLQIRRCKRRLFGMELIVLGSDELQQLFRPEKFPSPTDAAATKKLKFCHE